jgi:hypothetical protein
MGAAARFDLRAIDRGFTLAAKVFLPWFHGSRAWCFLHGAKINACPALFAEIRSDAEGEIHTPIRSAPHETDRLGLVGFLAHPHAPSAMDTIVTAERIAGLGDAAPYSHILDSPGVGRLGDQQFGYVVAHFYDLLRVGFYYHALFRDQGTRCGDL